MFNELDMGPRQRVTVAAAITLGAALILVLVFSAIVWGLSIFVGFFQNVLLPPVVAGILAMLLRPYYSCLITLCRGSRPAGLFLFFLSALVPLGLFIWFAGSFIINQLLRIIEEIPTMILTLQEAGRTHWPHIAALLEKYELTSKIGSLTENPGTWISMALQAVGIRISNSFVHVFQSAAGLLAWAVLPVYLAFFLMAKPFNPKHIGDFLPFLKKETRDDIVYLFDQFVGILLTFFRGQIIIALAQGSLFALGFFLVGLPYGIIIGMALGLLNIIPYLGSIAGLSVAAVFTIVQTIEGYILTPRIMGNRTGLHPAIIIFAVFFWGVALGGIFGMMLAIPLTAFAVVFWRLLKKKYIKEVV